MPGGLAIRDLHAPGSSPGAETSARLSASSLRPDGSAKNGAPSVGHDAARDKKWRQPIGFGSETALRVEREKIQSALSTCHGRDKPAHDAVPGEVQSFKVSKSGAYPIEIAFPLTKLHAPSDSLDAFQGAATNGVPTP
jgi:hypothetical protein